MGNCQTSEAATILIERPDGRTERLYFSVTAQEVMSSNPGHYLALVVTNRTTQFENKDGEVKRQLKLLRPSDSLLIGHLYRLVSFEDVLKEFNERKCAKMGKHRRPKDECGADRIPLQESEDMEAGTSNPSTGANYMRINRQQWRPALQSISEVGT